MLVELAWPPSSRSKTAPLPSASVLVFLLPSIMQFLMTLSPPPSLIAAPPPVVIMLLTNLMFLQLGLAPIILAEPVCQSQRIPAPVFLVETLLPSKIIVEFVCGQVTSKRPFILIIDSPSKVVPELL